MTNEHEAQDMPVRMPHDVMDYLVHGADPVDQAEAETLAATGDPRSYERAVARLSALRRTPSVRTTGRPIMQILADAFGDEDGD